MAAEPVRRRRAGTRGGWRRLALTATALAGTAAAVLAWLTLAHSGTPSDPNDATIAAARSAVAAPHPAASRSPNPAQLLPPIPGGPTGPAHQALPAPKPASTPVRLQIPAIAVDTPLQPLGLLPDGSLQAPSQWDVAGWYADGIRPGDPGPAVIAGHVDSVSGPAVFYRLRRLHVGDLVDVRDANGVMLRFIVDTIHEYPKQQFPSVLVYGPTPIPELRLVTCTGDFDWQAHSYLDNLVVSAHLIG